MNRMTRLALLVGSVVVLALALVGVSSQVADATSREIIRVDVAEDMTRFVMDEAPVYEEDGYPKHGNGFVTMGYIYPEGTLDGSNGTNPDGSPEFPDKVLGEWICRGYFINDGAHQEGGAWVITTQTLNFGAIEGEDMVVTEGYELSTPNEPGLRAITGGTGKFVGASGQAEQTLLGFNASEGVNLRFELRVRR